MVCHVHDPRNIFHNSTLLTIQNNGILFRGSLNDPSTTGEVKFVGGRLKVRENDVVKNLTDGGSSVNLGSINQDILPDSDRRRDLGSSTKRWDYGYFDDLHVFNDLTLNDDLRIFGQVDFRCTARSGTATTSAQGYVKVKVNGSMKRTYYWDD